MTPEQGDPAFRHCPGCGILVSAGLVHREGRLWHWDCWLQRAEEAARAFAEALQAVLDIQLPGALVAWDEYVDAKQALARHPGFLPNDPGENG